MNIDRLYKDLDHIMTHREEFLEHIREHEDLHVQAAYIEGDTTDDNVRYALGMWLTEETDLTPLQLMLISFYLAEQHDFKLGMDIATPRVSVIGDSDE